MVQGKDRWPLESLGGDELRRKQREIANVMRDVVRDRYNPTMTSPSMYREDPSPRSGGEPSINGVPARLVEAAQNAAREDAEQTDRWRAFREAQERDFEAAKAAEPWLTWDAWIKRKEDRS